MSRDDGQAADADADAETGGGGPYAEAITAIADVFAGYRRVASEAGGLAAVEARLAANAAVRMLGAGVFAAIITAAAWLLIQAAAFVWLRTLGTPAVWLLLGLAVLNLLAVAVLRWYLRWLSRHLTFERTRQLVLGERGSDARAHAGRQPAEQSAPE